MKQWDKAAVYRLLTERGIWHEITEHPAVYNMEEMAAVDLPYPEADGKNLFVRDDKKRQYYLITVRGDKRVDLKAFRQANHTRPLSFASAEDLWDKPLIISHQRNQGKELSAWMKRDISKLNVVATYNLLFNASLLVDEGLGYAIGFDKIINITENSSLCFRPLQPNIEIEMSLVWKKYQIFTKAAEQFIKKIEEMQAASPTDRGSAAL